MSAAWWNEMARDAAAAGHAQFSAAWYEAMRDMHAERFPNADARTRTNMRLLVEWAERKAA